MIDAIFLDWVIGITTASAIGAWLGDPDESKRIYRTAWIRTRLAVPFVFCTFSPKGNFEVHPRFEVGPIPCKLA